jgi:predicted phage tail protein
MKTVYLHGSLKEKFGEKFNFHVANPAMMIRALISQVKGFSACLREGEFCIVRGDKEEGIQLGIDEIALKFGKCNEMHIIPVVQGAGGRAGGIIKTILGIALLGFGIAGAALAAGGFAAGLGTAAFALGGMSVTYGSIAVVGLGMTALGISSVVSSRVDTPKSGPGSYDSRELADNRPSFLFNGPVNRVEQGGAVPMVFGRMRVGSVVVSAGLSAENF